MHRRAVFFVKYRERGKQIGAFVAWNFGELLVDDLLGELVQVALRRQAVHGDDTRSVLRLGPARRAHFVTFFDERCVEWCGWWVEMGQSRRER